MGERNAIDDAHWRATIERLQLGPGLRPQWLFVSTSPP
jgi:hypothetical protein